MEGSLIESMADAVENARVVLLCYSEKYKESRNCRTGNINLSNDFNSSRVQIYTEANSLLLHVCLPFYVTYLTSWLFLLMPNVCDSVIKKP